MNLCEKWKWIFLHIHERIESWVCDCDSNLQQDKIHFSSSIIILTIRNDRMVNFFIETITIIPYFAQDAISSCFSLLWIIIIYLQVPRHQFPKIDRCISSSQPPHISFTFAREIEPSSTCPRDRRFAIPITIGHEHESEVITTVNND